MADSFTDPIDEIEVWDGNRLRVMIVWDVEADRFTVRFPKTNVIPALGMMERAKLLIATELKGKDLDKNAAGPAGNPAVTLLFSGPKDVQ